MKVYHTVHKAEHIDKKMGKHWCSFQPRQSLNQKVTDKNSQKLSVDLCSYHSMEKVSNEKMPFLQYIL